MDGDEGSVCVLAGSQLPGAKSPFLPASQGGGGCNLGLNCVSLQVCETSAYGALALDGEAARGKEAVALHFACSNRRVAALASMQSQAHQAAPSRGCATLGMRTRAHRALPMRLLHRMLNPGAAVLCVCRAPWTALVMATAR
jgi:hypothetical protein